MQNKTVRIKRRFLLSTFHVDVNGGCLLGALLQADVAAHVKWLSPGDVQRGHPVHLFLSPHLRPLLPLPLHRLHTLAAQLQGCAERDDNVGAGRGDGGLGVACDGIEREKSTVYLTRHWRKTDRPLGKTIYPLLPKHPDSPTVKWQHMISQVDSKRCQVAPFWPRLCTITATLLIITLTEKMRCNLKLWRLEFGLKQTYCAFLFFSFLSVKYLHRF